MRDVFHSLLLRMDAYLARYTLLGRIRMLLFAWQALLLVLLVAVYVGNTVRLVRTSGSQRMDGEVLLARTRFAEWNGHILQDAAFLAQATALTQAVAAGDAAQAERIASRHARNLAMDNIDVVDRNGEYLAEVHLLDMEEFPGEEALFQRALNGEVVQTPLVIPATTERPAEYLMTAVIPLRDERGAVVGALLTGRLLGQERLNQLLSMRSDIFVALHYDGEVLLDDGRPHSEALDELLQDTASSRQAQESGQPLIHSLVGSLPHMAPYIGAYVPLDIGQDDRTVLVVGLDMAPFLRYGRATVLLFVLLVVLGTSLLHGVLTLLIRHVVVTPLRAMTEAAEAMAAGEYDRKVPLFSTGAMGQLARAFNRMAEAVRTRDRQLRQFSRTLEAQVAERTAELQRMVVALESAANAVVITDTEGVIRWANPAFTRLTGYTTEEAVGQSPRILKSGMHTDEFYRELWETIQAGKTWRGEMVNRRKDGSLYLEYMTIAPVRDAHGNVTDYIAIKEDITERHRLLEELQRARQEAEAANQAKSQFLANMSHEFRTPLTAIIGYSELLEEDVRDLGYTDLLPDVQKIRTAGEHLSSLVDTVLDLAKIEAGYMKLDLHTFSVEGMLRAVIATVDPLFIKNGNRLKVETQPGLGEMTADPTKTRQILINLLGNANKFTRQGVVTLRARRFGDEEGRAWIEFQVEDTGIGMTAEELENVFDEFVQADITVTREFGGTGLGLSVSRHFCEMMGGSIRAESTPGEGSTFRVLLPAQVTAS